MKNNNIKVIVITLLILVISFFIFFLCFKLFKNLSDDKQILDLKESVENLKDKNDGLQRNLTELQIENVNLRKNMINDSNELCTFIKTLRIIGFYDSYASDNNHKYIIVEQFQSFMPFILRVNSNMAKDLKKDKYYEFTFKGSKNLSDLDGALSNFSIVSINYTDKVGLSQIQETCE